MDYRIAKFVRWVEPGESLDELVNDAKSLTWEFESEHAVLRLSSGRRVLVSGGRVGIQFEVEEGEPYDSFGRPSVKLYVDVDGEKFIVERIEFHTHPMATGPSDWDLRVLEMLKQRTSRIHEINGPRGGTVIRPKRRKNHDSRS